MISESEILELLSDKDATNIVLKEFEFKPTKLAMHIATLSNLGKDFGYLILGATKTETGYIINGVSREFSIDLIIKKAISFLNQPPRIEFSKLSINGNNIFAIKVFKIDNSISHTIDLVSSDKCNLFVKDLLKCCIRLQSTHLYSTASEDECNDFIAALLESRGYNVKDQSRRGSSPTGKNSGEVDIFVDHSTGFPLTIVEALMIDSVDKTYINSHLDKIYNYDKLGNEFNVCLSYVKVSNFKSFWDKYCEHVKLHLYPFTAIAFDKSIDDKFPFSEIRIAKTTLDRNGNTTCLYHICVHI